MVVKLVECGGCGKLFPEPNLHHGQCRWCLDQITQRHQRDLEAENERLRNEVEALTKHLGEINGK